MPQQVFISYRRADSEGYVGRLRDQLIAKTGEDILFLDVDDIAPGQDFTQAIDDAISTCKVLVAVIGPQWVDIEDREGNRRLDNPHDFVRLEVATALQRGILVIPVLVQRARMPKADQLPEDLKELSKRNALELSHNRFSRDVDDLVEAIKAELDSQPQMPSRPIDIPQERPEVFDDLPDLPPAPPVPNQDGFGTLIIERPSAWMYSAVNFKIFIDGEQVLDVGKGSTETTQIPAGQRIISAQTWMGGMSKSEELTFDMPAGGSAHFLVKYTMSLTGKLVIERI